ncbi:MAG TPA: hypothetical protein VMY05_03325 [Acidobacteriota bacterium]|nr:hypothetical protein [Acidobacteriota bacterium]
MKRLVVSVLALLLVLGTTGSAQEDNPRAEFLRIFPLSFPSVLDLAGGGARAHGMGKAFLGISDDISAVTWNPAGLYGQEKEGPSLGLDYSTFTPKAEYSVFDQSSYRDAAFKNLGMLSFLAPLRIKGHPFVGGASYTRAGDEYMSTEVTFVNPDYYYVDRQGLLQPGLDQQSAVNDYRSSPDMVNIGFGTRLANTLSFGVAANVYTGESAARQHVILIQDGVEPSFLQPVRVTEDLLVLDTGKFSGVNFTIGLKYSGEKISAGLVVRTPFSLQVKTNRTVFTTLLFNGDPRFEGTNEIHFDNIVAKMKMPVQFGGGVAYRPIEGLVVATDVEYRGFSGKMIEIRDSLRIIPGEKDQEFYSEIDPMWRNVLLVRVGAEYLWNTGSKLFPVVPIRAGYGHVQIPDPELDMFFEISTASQGNFSAGSGIHWGQIHLDAAYTYTALDRHYWYYVDVQAIPFELSNRSHSFNFTFTGFFD